jgi:hypothetical protein
MSRRKKRKQKEQGKQQHASSPQPDTQTSPTPAPAAVEDAPVEELKKEAAEAKVEVPEIGAGSEPSKPEKDLRRELAALIAGYRKAEQDLKTKELRLLKEQEGVEKTKAELELARAELATERQSFKEDGDRLTEQRGEVDAREATIKAREEDAANGFADLRKGMLGKLEELREEALKRLEHADERAAKLEEECVQKYERRLAELRATEEELRQSRAEVERAKREAEWDKEDLEDLKAHIEDYAEKKAAAGLAEKDEDLDRTRERNRSLQERMAKLEAALEERESALRTLENMSPEAIKARLNSQKARIKELEDELSNRPSGAEAEELSDLRQWKAGWQSERATLLFDKGRLESQLGRLRIDVDTNEVLRDRNRALLENQRLLRAAIDDLQSDIDERLDKHRDKPTFPEMLRMDSDRDLSEEPENLYPPSELFDLETFAEDLRHRMGMAPGQNDRPELYYRPEDVRAFLGGLAMSRLHLLQGISGIGKSSLPRAFAEAVGGSCETVSVQAGWRDRNDLFGYFNSFENRYYESGFVQAIYRAQTPQWSDRMCLVLLDEMNLSHPEQYGADVLDVLERTDTANRRFELLPFEPPGAKPAGLEEGRYLPLPGNVWFIGTANHDETTKDFAPKTYDRSFVLELPDQPEPFKLKRTNNRAPVSCRALLKGFDLAGKEHEEEADLALKWLDSNLRAPMQDLFRIGWGGRLEGQTSRFVPVVIAAGGEIGEAVDQLIATRLLRKIKGRYDNLQEDLEALQAVFESSWPSAWSHQPVASLRLLEHELKRLRG